MAASVDVRPPGDPGEPGAALAGAPVPLAARLAGPAARFVAVGGFNTALSYVLFRAALRAYGGGPTAAAAAQATAYGTGILVAYAANRRWTFRSDRAHAGALPRFVAFQLTALALSAALLRFGVATLGLEPTACWVGVTGLTAVANFVSQRFWMFPERPAAAGRAAP